ncbi:MAG: hypothetical protein Unbinned1327contig1000_10 [Prokaryotic dsDNA virus sp.]|nr:MAG: hypothetical protein Unbinned1327contig1000_10 [Prokaryotic dsDNA virus sp.]|tara:strand:- start:10212 stop:10424 length:213 start_codon:yes stop_codon:yes gene_type:complete
MDNEILIALGRLEGKVDALIARQAIHDEELDRHDKRLRELEQSKSWLLGVSAAAGAVAGFVINYIGSPGS